MKRSTIVLPILGAVLLVASSIFLGYRIGFRRGQDSLVIRDNGKPCALDGGSFYDFRCYVPCEDGYRDKEPSPAPGDATTPVEPAIPELEIGPLPPGPDLSPGATVTRSGYSISAGMTITDKTGRFHCYQIVPGAILPQCFEVVEKREESK